MSTSRYWYETILFVTLGFISIVISLIPMSLSPESVGFPDLLFCLFTAWIIRRPASTPMMAILFLSVLADAFMMRPIGLWALLLFAGMEGVRIFERPFREIPFVLEWVYVGLLFIALTLLKNVLLFLSFSYIPGFSETSWHVLRTAAIYPAVVFFLHWSLGVRHVTSARKPNKLGAI